MAYFAFSCWLSVYKPESVLLDLLVTVSVNIYELVQLIQRISYATEHF